MKNSLLPILFIFLFTQVSAQITNPNSVSYDAIDGYKGSLNDPNSNYFEIRSRMDSLIQNYSGVDYSLKQYKRFIAFWDTRAGVDPNNPGKFKDYIEVINSWTASTSVCEDDLTGVNWINIGPTNIKQSGQTVLANGIVTAVYMNPNNINEILAGTNCSGIWRTADFGSNWECVTDNLRFPGLGIEDFEVNPNNTNHIVASTGKFTYGNRYGVGILESFDGGLSWTRNENFPYQEYPVTFKTAFDPLNPNGIFVVTNLKLLYSYDLGTNWVTIFDLTSTNPNFNINPSYFQELNDIVITGTGTVFLGASKTNNSSSQIWKHESNAGNVWTDISSQLAPVDPTIILEVFFTEEANGKFFMGVSDTNDMYIFKTVDNGQSFTFYNTSVLNSGGLDKYCFSTGLTGPERVYNGSCGLFATTSLANSQMYSELCSRITPDMHTDNRASQTLVDQSGNEWLVIGHDGGVSVLDVTGSPSGSPHYNSTQGVNGNNFAITQSYALSLSQFLDKKLITGNQDNKTFSYDLINSEWATLGPTGDGHANWMSSDGSRYVYTRNRDFFAINLNGVSSFNVPFSLNMPMRVDEKKDRLYYSPEIDPSVIVVIDNNTTSTYPVIDPSGDLQRITEIEFAESNVNVVYFSGGVHELAVSGGANAENKLYKTVDGFQSQQNLSNSIVYDANGGNPKLLREVAGWKIISAMKVNPSNPNELWIGLSGVVLDDFSAYNKYRCLHSVDGGNIWYDYSVGLPPFPVNDIEFIKGTDKFLLIGTDVGMFIRGGNMGSWICYQGEMPVSVITDIQIDYCDNKVYAATYGRGVYVSELDLNISPEFPELRITNHQTIEETYNCVSSIEIESGGHLEVSGTLFMNKGTKIIVKPGGRLTINGGTVTNACGDLWRGVQLYGNSNYQQTYTNQGTLIMSNGGTIEHAEIGVENWKHGDYATTGGIIRCTNAVFRNNKKDVECMKFQNTGSAGQYLNDLSYFTKTQFLWDDELRVDVPLPHVLLYKVSGIRFTGCTFADDRTNPASRYLTTQTNNHTGIHSLDAKYYVRAHCNNASIYVNWSNCSGDLNSGNWTPTTFRDLDFGIYASNSHTENSILVDRSRFENNLYGILIVNSNDPIVTQSEFEYTAGNNFESVNSPQYGIHVVRTKGIRFEENSFTASGITNSSAGIVCSDLGESLEELYKNDFTNIRYAVVTQGKNRNYVGHLSNSNGEKGLQFICDSNFNNSYDHLVKDDLWGNTELPNSTGDFLFGVRKDNTGLNTPSGNVFTANGNAFEDYRNLSHHIVNYYYDYYSPNETPQGLQVQGPFSAWPMLVPNACISKLSDLPIINIGSVKKEQLSNDFSSGNTNYIQIRNTLVQNLDGGDKEALLIQIDALQPNNKQSLRQALNASPYLSEEVIRAVADNHPSLYPHPWTLELILDNIHVARSNEFMNFLIEKEHPLPPGMINQIQNELGTGDLSDLEILELEMSDALLLRDFSADFILRNFKSDTAQTDIDSIKQWIINKNDVLAEVNLIDLEIQSGKFVDAQIRVNNLGLNLSQYPLHLQEELVDVIELKERTLAILSKTGGLPEMTDNDHLFLTDMAKNGKGIAQYQAQEILCFFFNECTVRFVDLPSLPKSNFSIGQSISEYNSNNSIIKMYPNPAEDWVAFELPLDDFTYLIQIKDINGKLISDHLTTKQLYILETGNLSRGIYMIQIINQDLGEFVSLEKLVIAR